MTDKSSALPFDSDSFFPQFYREYQQFVYQQAWKYTSAAFDVDDLVQDVWLKLCQKCELLSTYSKKQQLSYLAVAVRNTAISNARKAKGSCSIDFLENAAYDGANLLDEIFDRKFRIEAFRAAWVQVPGTTRELLERKYILMESDEEIARQMQIHPNSVRMALSRARKQAFSILQHFEKTFS